MARGTSNSMKIIPQKPFGEDDSDRVLSNFEEENRKLPIQKEML